jgi:hypothetical protein
MRLLLLLLLLTIPSTGNSKEVRGYIINNEGDTTMGTFTIGKNLLMPVHIELEHNIHFRPDNGKKKRYEPKMLKGYVLYEGISGDTAEYRTVVFQEHTNPVQKLSDVTVFMFLLERGKIEMFHYMAYVNKLERSAPQQMAQADKLYFHVPGEKYSIKVPMYEYDKDFSSPMNYMEWFAKQLGDSHPVVIMLNGKMTIDDVITEIGKFNKLNP